MRLTKQHIETIDRCLKEKGISYWDIRLELIDHIACEIEQKEGDYDFDELLKQTLEKLGWNTNLKNLEQQKLKSINAKFRSAYFKKFLSLFKNLKSIILVFAGILIYYMILNNTSQRLFNFTTIILFVGPIGFITLHYAITSFRIKKSGYVFYAYFYVIFAMLMTNFFYQIPKPGGFIDVSMATRNTIVFVATIFNVLFTVGGIKIYLETYNEFNAIYKNLVK